MITHKPTVTVAVCAYNEEGNIEKFLRSILRQKETNFKLNKIIVVSDGSTDGTVNKIKKFKSKKIEIIEYENRQGKSSRLNKIYRSFKTDFLVQSDADVIFNDTRVIAFIINPLINNKKVGLCGGNPIAVEGKTFTEKAINVTHDMYRKFRLDINNGNNIFSADGRLLALSKRFARKLVIPTTMIANDMFAYFTCFSMGLEYRYVDNAIVLYRSPQNLKDHIKQNTRFEAGPIRMEKYFDKSLVHNQRNLPKLLLFKYMLVEFFIHPFLSSYIFIVNAWCRFLARKMESSLDAKWNIAVTTKKI